MKSCNVRYLKSYEQKDKCRCHPDFKTVCECGEYKCDCSSDCVCDAPELKWHDSPEDMVSA